MNESMICNLLRSNKLLLQTFIGAISCSCPYSYWTFVVCMQSNSAIRGSRSSPLIVSSDSETETSLPPTRSSIPPPVHPASSIPFPSSVSSSAPLSRSGVKRKASSLSAPPPTSSCSSSVSLDSSSDFYRVVLSWSFSSPVVFSSPPPAASSDLPLFAISI